MEHRILKRENCAVELELKADPADVQKKLQSEVSKLGKKVNIPGFRQGRAPQSLLLQRFGDDLLQDLALEYAREALPKVVESEKIRLIGQPRIINVDLGKGKSNTVIIGLEEQPEVDLKPEDYKGLSVEIGDYSVKDKAVAEAIDNMRQDFAELVAVTDRAAQDGDLVEVDIQITPADGAAAPAENYKLRLGEDNLVEGFDQHVVGRKAGEEFTVAHKVAEAAADAPLASYRVTVLGISENKLPEFDDEFAKQHEAETAAELKQRIREQLEQWMENNRKRELDEKVKVELTKKNTIPVPRSMAENVLADMRQQVEMMLQRAPAEQRSDFNEAEWRQSSLPAAEAQVRVYMLLAAIGRAENIKVTDADIEAQAKEMAKAYNVEPKKIISQWRQGDYWENMRFNLLQEKALKVVIDNADIKVKSSSVEE